MNLMPSPTTQLQDQDMTAAQGFEPVGQNVIFLYPGDCPHCLRPFSSRGKDGVIRNVFTSYGKDQWCSECAEKGEKEGICVLESKLSKEEIKLWEKELKKSI